MEVIGVDFVDIFFDVIGFKMLELGCVDFVYIGEVVGNYLIKLFGFDNMF